MMEEIRFRAWDKYYRTMRSVCSLLFNSKGEVRSIAVFYKNENTINYRSPNALFLMQYTGFKDKHGKEVYDGDIVLVEDANNHLRPNGSENIVIKWDYYGWLPAVGGLCDTSKYTLLGNIYENPELLKKEKKK